MPRGRLLLPITILAIVSLSVGCGGETGEVLLRYTPQVGGTYRYKLGIASGMEVTGEMHVLSEGENGYQIEFSGTYFDELFSSSLTITERHNSNDPGYISLNFPDGPVGAGAAWDGEVPWYYENYYVLDPREIRVPSSYRLLEVKQGEYGKLAIIEQRTEADVAVDGLVLHVGQVGVRWDPAGRITEVHQGYDAWGKLQVGDVLVGINGQSADAAGGPNWLAEEYIQRPKESRTVTFTIARGGEEFDIDVEKSIDELARVKVYNLSSKIKTTFDVDRGILLSAEASSGYDVAYTSPTVGTFPVVDDYGGFSKFGYLDGKAVYQERLDSQGVAWILSLVE